MPPAQWKSQPTELRIFAPLGTQGRELGGGRGRPLAKYLLVLLGMSIILVPTCVCEGGKIRALVMGMVYGNSMVEGYFREEPLIDCTPIPCRDTTGLGMEKMIKFVRLYFPRTYEEMQTYGFIMFISPEYYIFTAKQDMWMYQRIMEGAGGYNDGSVFSIITQIHTSWANSLTQQAFPNDAPAVVARGNGGESPVQGYRVMINKEFADPVFTPFVKYKVEDITCNVGRFVIPRQGAGILTWQVGNFPSFSKVPMIIAWNYEKGRTITNGGFEDWFRRENPYGADMLVNLVLYATQRPLIEDVDVFHRIKVMFRQYSDRLEFLVTLKDFVDAFGANTQPIQEAIWGVEELGRRAKDLYLNQDFTGASQALEESFSKLDAAEVLARKVKNSALFWVYLSEWLITTATFFISGFVLWSLMVRRKMYRQVTSTKFER